MKKYGCYVRVSTIEQANEGHSIEEQISRTSSFCDAMNWKPVQIYSDAGFTGGNTSRPALQQMLADVRHGLIEKVVVYKLDRLSRSQLDTLDLIENVFLANNCDFISITENFDTSTPFGRAMIGILAVFAQLEREQIRERMSIGKYARAKQGKFHGSNHVPTGYDYSDGKLVKNEFEALQIQRIFDLYESGKSCNEIADTLNNAGMVHKFGSWTENVVRNILKKKTYLGYIKYHDEWFLGEHEPIISEEQFDHVQDIIRSRSTKNTGKSTSYLGGMLICKICGAKYAKTTQRKGNYKYCYYECNSRTKKRDYLIKDPNCKNKHWRMEELDAIVFDEIKKLSLVMDEQREIEEPDVISGEIEKLESQIRKLMDLYAIGTVPIEMIKEKTEALEEQKRKLEAEKSRFKPSLHDMEHSIKSFADILEKGNFDQIKTVLHELIEYIEIDGEDITIHWNFV